MQRIAILLLILAVGVGVYFLVKETEPAAPEPPHVVDDGNLPDPPPGPTGLDAPDRTTPVTVPSVRQLETPARLLMIGRHRTPWSVNMEQTFKVSRNLQFRVWYLMDIHGGGAEGVAGDGRGLPELKARPTAQYLRSQAIQALVFDQADPNALPMEFWNAVAERVQDGTMGLCFHPGGVPLDDANQALTAHPALGHPVLKELLPVARASSIEGQPVPGVFAEKQPLRPTAEGLTHPATRILTDPEKSKELWTAAGEGKGGWGSQFCYPVQEVKPGAVVLVELESAVPIPAVIASGGRTRVLWVGPVDFGGRETYFAKDKNLLRNVLLNDWWIWLLGRK